MEHDWRGSIFVATMDLFEVFFTNPPASDGDEEVWDRLEEMAWELHGLTCDASSGSPGYQRQCLLEAEQQCRACAALLEPLAASPLVVRARRGVAAVAYCLQRALAVTPGVALS